MKRILAAACINPVAVFDTAFLLAKRFEAHVVGLGGAWPRQTLLSWNENAGSMLVEGALQLEQEEEERIRKARTCFLSIASERGVPIRPVPRGRVGAGAEWHYVAAPGEGRVGCFGRAFDLIVVEQPKFLASFAQARLDGAILESGRPVLMATTRPSTNLGTRVLTVWRGSIACSRAVALAMPFVKKSAHIEVIVSPSSASTSSAGELERCLKAHASSVSFRHLGHKERLEGDAIMTEADRVGADLVIAGAYCGGRLRELLIGGGTQSLVNAASIPILFAH